jgi:hypothetical protein
MQAELKDLSRMLSALDDGAHDQLNLVVKAADK